MIEEYIDDTHRESILATQQIRERVAELKAQAKKWTPKIYPGRD